MNDKTLAALRGSIEKWEGIVAGEVADHGIVNCPLCKEFIDHECGGCPVADKTGTGYCDGSPYEVWIDLVGHRTGEKANTEERQIVAKEELEFLKSLLPQEAK